MARLTLNQSLNRAAVGKKTTISLVKPQRYCQLLRFFFFQGTLILRVTKLRRRTNMRKVSMIRTYAVSNDFEFQL